MKRLKHTAHTVLSMNITKSVQHKVLIIGFALMAGFGQAAHAVCVIHGVPTTPDNEQTQVDGSSELSGLSAGSTEGCDDSDPDPNIKPSTPTWNSVPSKDGNGSYTVKWNSVSGAKYILSEKVGSTWHQRLYYTTSLSYSPSGRADGYYRYRVKACEQANCSDWRTSNQVRVARTPGTPGTINGASSYDRDGKYTLSWAKASGTVDYYEYREKKNSNAWPSSWTKIGKVLSKSISGKSNGSYTYQVRACNTVSSCGSARTSNKVTVLHKPGMPSSIKNNTSVSEAKKGSYTISWGSASGTVHRYVLRENHLPFGGSWAGWSTAYSGLGSSNKRPPRSNGEWNYAIKACNTLNGSELCSSYRYISTKVIVFKAPTGVTAPAESKNGAPFTVDWDNMNGATNYHLKINNEYQTFSLSKSTYNSPSNLAAKTYKYEIQASATGRLSHWSTPIYVKVSYDPVTQAPVMTSATKQTTSKAKGDIKVTWNAVPNARTYKVYRSGVFLREVGGGAYTYENQDFGKSYTFSVYGCTPTPQCGPASTQTIRLDFEPAENLSGPSNVRDGKQFSLSWSGATHAVLEENGTRHNKVYTETNDRPIRLTRDAGTYKFRLKTCFLGDTPTPDQCTGGYGKEITVKVIGAPGIPSSIQNDSPLNETLSGYYTISWGTASGVVHRYHLRQWSRKLGSDGQYTSPGGWANFDKGMERTLIRNHMPDADYRYLVKACNTFSGEELCSDERELAGGVRVWTYTPSDTQNLNGPSKARENFFLTWSNAGDPGDRARLRIDGDWDETTYHHENASGPNKILMEDVSVGTHTYSASVCIFKDLNGGNAYVCAPFGRIIEVKVIPAPNAPSDIKLEKSYTDGQSLEVSWKAPTSGAKVGEYKLEYSHEGGAWKEYNPPTSNADTLDTANPPTTETVGNLKRGYYRFQVSACNTYNETRRCSSTIQTNAVAYVAELADETVNEGNLNLPTSTVTVGEVSGQGGVSGGQASYSFPIQLPPGRNGMQPNLSVNYSSQAGNGTLGMGWSLSAGSAITRCGQTSVHDGRNRGVQYDEHDRLCLDGQRLLIARGGPDHSYKSEDYGKPGTVYRTELDNFARVTQTGSLSDRSSWFKVELKNGRVLYYGHSDDSTHSASGVTAPLSWAIKREQDRTATQNSIIYEYDTFADGEHLLTDIYYTGSGNSKGSRQVKIDYQNRADFSSRWLAGGLTRQTQRMEKITTYVGTDDPVREYHFEYKHSQATDRSLLINFYDCAYDEIGSPYCLAPTAITWKDAKPSFVLEKVGYRNTTGNNYEEGGSIVAQLQDRDTVQDSIPHGDTNGDGSPDWPGWSMNAEGFRDNDFAAPVHQTCKYQPYSFSYSCIEADFDQDGKTDSWRIHNSRLQIKYATAINWLNTDITVNTSEDGPVIAADYNGDGWPDLMVEIDVPTKSSNQPPKKLYLWLNSSDPAVPFPSSNSQLVFTAQESGGSDPVALTSIQHVGDMNGDGTPDLMEATVDLEAYAGFNPSEQPVPNTLKLTHVNNGLVTFTDIDLSNNEMAQVYHPTERVYHFHYFMDVNGDGLPDWIAWKGIQNLNILWLSINKGNGQFGEWQSLSINSKILPRNVGINVPNDPGAVEMTFYPKYAHAFRQFDYDADGRAELLVPHSTPLAEACLMDHVTGHRPPNNDPVTKDFCGNEMYNHYRELGNTGDVKNLNLSRIDDNVYRYKAFRFEEQPSGLFKVKVITSTQLIGSATQTAPVDGYGNGLQDLVFAYGCRANSDPNLGGAYCTVEDLNVNGQTYSEGLYINRNRGSATGNERYEPVDMIANVETAQGVRNEWHLRPLSSEDSRYHDSGGSYYEPDFDYLDDMSIGKRRTHFNFTSSMYVVASHQRSNGVDGLNEIQYRYKGAMYNHVGRGFQGFRSIITEDISAGLKSQSDFHQVFPLAGKLERTRQWALNDSATDDAINETSYIWQMWALGFRGIAYTYTVDSPMDIWIVNPTTPTAVVSVSQTSYRRKLEKFGFSREELYQQNQIYSFDNYGNILDQTERYEEPNGVQINSKHTHTDYQAHNFIDWWINKPDSQTITQNAVQNRHNDESGLDTSSDQTQSVTINYLAWDGAARQPTAIKTTPGSGKWTQVDTLYNSNGLPTSITQSAQGETSNRTTTTTYSTNGYFPYSVTKTVGGSLDHVITTEVNARHGQVNWTEDINGNRTTTSYDAFARLTEIQSPGMPKQYLTINECDSTCPALAILRVTQTQDGSPTTVQYLDKLGRTIETATQAFDGVSYIHQGIGFNVLGQKVFESVPNFNSVSSVGTSYDSYDLLGRLTQKTVDQTKGQTLVIKYKHEQGLRGFTTEIDANGHLLNRTYNGLKQLIKTKDAEDGITRYAYNGAGQPIALEDANGNPITAGYNALGQKDWVIDPNMGRKDFTYTGFGEVETETDANTDITKYEYDELGRVTARYVNNIQEASFEYDQAANGIGLPSKEQRHNLINAGEAFSKTYTYDSLSRLETTTTHIDGEDFLVQNQYDATYGRITNLIYPGGTQGLNIEYGYNAQGYSTTISNAASGYVYQEITAEDAWSNWTQANMADNNANASRSFYAETGQANMSELNGVGGLLHKQSYPDYDDFGNLETIITNVPSLTPSDSTETFTYDLMHRLLTSTRTNDENINYQYDKVGNLKKKDDYGITYHYNDTKPNAVSSVDLKQGGSITFGYDANGNRTHENGAKTLKYNAFNKPIKIQRNGFTLEFFYGADQMRYKQIKTSRGSISKTYYIEKLFEKITGVSSTKYRFFIGDVAVLTKDISAGTEQLSLTHRDRLGSPLAMLDQNGNLIETHSYDPFGKPRLGNQSDKAPPILNSQQTTRGFTDHEHLDNVQLIHMNGRAYDYNLGRFLSVDPIIQDPGNSQSMNPYSYIMNNPMSGTDPSGYCSAETGTRMKKCVDVNVVDENTGENLGTRSMNSMHSNFKGHVAGYAASQLGSNGQVTSVSAKMSNGKTYTASNGGQTIGGMVNRLSLSDEFGAEGSSNQAGMFGNIPWSTYLGTSAGESAAQTWANWAVAAENRGEMSWHLHFMGGLASLWTPDTAFDTASTLLGGGVFSLGKRAYTYAGSKIIGTAQSTGTLGHATISKMYAYMYALNPNVTRVTMDLGYKRLFDGFVKMRGKWGPRPDVAALYRDGSVAIREIASKTDKVAKLITRNQQKIEKELLNGTVKVNQWAQKLHKWFKD